MRQANVLIVDSDALIRSNLKTQVTAMGYRVVGEAESGNQALALIRNLRPDVVLLDLMLPSLSGTSVAQTLFTERLAAVIGFATEEDGASLDALDDAGVMGFVTKPFRLIDLRAAISIAAARFQERIALEEEVKSLNERMEARKLVGRAKAILMERHGLSERDAFKRIQSQSIALGKQAHEIAQAIITASEIAAGGTGAAGSALTTPNSNEARPSTVRSVRTEKAALDAVQP